jgi:hypothetical protein
MEMEEFKEESPQRDSFTGSDHVYRDFVLMSIFFTLNMGCVTTLTAVASNELGKDLGGDQQAALYASLMVSSLFLAAYCVSTFGPKLCLICSNACVFFSYIGVIIAINTDDPSAKSLAAISGAAVAGLGLGLGWAGQGVYFGRAATKYARGARLHLRGVSTMFGSNFAAIFLGIEVALKVGSTVIRLLAGSSLFFTVYTILAGVSTIGICFVPDVKNAGTIDSLADDEPDLLTIMYNQAGQVGTLLATNRKLQLMAIPQFAFGIYTVFLNGSINSRVLIMHFNPAYIGLFSALGAIPWVSFVRSRLDSAFGDESKSVVMALMTCAFVAIASPLVILQPDQVSKVGVFFLYFSAGIARSSYEFANRSIFVDFFPHDQPAAMPSIFLLQGLATVLCFVTFQFDAFTLKLQALLLLVVACAALAAYRVAFQMYLAEKREEKGSVDGMGEMGGDGSYVMMDDDAADDL